MKPLLASALLLVALACPASGQHAPLPSLDLQDQEGRSLRLDGLRGKVVVIVYGGRKAVDSHVTWGKRLDAELCQRGVYRASDPEAERPVRILAVAQMGKIPELFRGMVRAGIRPHVEKGYSLWLDWEDRLAGLYGAEETASTVIVADRAGAVRLVVTGRPDGEPYRAVLEALRSQG